MEDLTFKAGDRVLILGATGFIPKRLVKALAEKEVKLRILASTPARAKQIIPEGSDTEIVQGDLMNEVICIDKKIDQYVPIEKISFEDTVKIATSEETSGPGVTGL